MASGPFLVYRYPDTHRHTRPLNRTATSQDAASESVVSVCMWGDLRATDIAALCGGSQHRWLGWGGFVPCEWEDGVGSKVRSEALV